MRTRILHLFVIVGLLLSVLPFQSASTQAALTPQPGNAASDSNPDEPPIPLTASTVLLSSASGGPPTTADFAAMSNWSNFADWTYHNPRSLLDSVAAPNPRVHLSIKQVGNLPVNAAETAIQTTDSLNLAENEDIHGVTGNNVQANRVHGSYAHTVSRLPDEEPSTLIHSSDTRIVHEPIIPVVYTVMGAESNSAQEIDAYYSLNGDGQWLPATIVDKPESSRAISLPPDTVGEGTQHTILWNAHADGVYRSDNVVFRIAPHFDTLGVGSTADLPNGSNSRPFRVHIPDLSSSYSTVQPAIASPGSILTYTLVLRNTDDVPAPNVDVRWKMAEHTSLIAATATQGAPVVLYHNQNHEADIRWQGTLTSGESITMTAVTRLDDFLPDGLQVIAIAEYDGLPLGDSTMTTTVRSAPDLTASTLTVDRNRAQPGDVLTYTAHLVNLGNMHMPWAFYSYTLPANATWVGNIHVTPNLGASGQADGVFQWYGPLTVSLPITLTYHVRVNDHLPPGTVIAGSASLSDFNDRGILMTAPAVVVYSDQNSNMPDASITNQAQINSALMMAPNHSVTSIQPASPPGNSLSAVRAPNAKNAGLIWPTFHYNAQRTGKSPYSGPQDSTIAWTFHTGGAIYSSPAIDANGTVYVGSENQKLYAINPDGTLKWMYPTNGGITSSPAIGQNGTVYVGSRDQRLYAINPNGTLSWVYTTTGEIYASPAIGQDGTLYVGSADGYLYAINPTGTLKCRYYTGGGTPAIGLDGTIYNGGAFDGMLYALDPTCALKWTSVPAANVIGATPVVSPDGTAVYYGAEDGYLYAINTISGALKWKSPFTHGGVRSSPAIGSDGTIYVSTMYGNLWALNPADGSLKWSNYTSLEASASPAVGADGAIYYATNYRGIYVVNPDGTLKWSRLVGNGDFRSSPAIGSNGALYIGSTDGALYTFNARPSVGGPTVGPWLTATSLPQPEGTTRYQGQPIVFHNGRVYIFGGANDSNPMLTNVYYNAIESNGSLGPWVETTPLPSGYFDQEIVCVGEYVYLITGANGASAVYYAPINSDGSLGTWVKTVDLLPTRQDFAIATYNEYIYSSGGNSSGTKDFVKYTSVKPGGSLNSWADTTPLPEPLQGHTMVAHDGYLYVMAPSATVYYAPINADGTVMSWTTTISLPHSMSNFTTFEYNNYLYLLGGNSSSVYYAPFLSDHSLGQWVATTALPEQRGSLWAGGQGSFVYAVGGYNGSVYTNTVYYTRLQTPPINIVVNGPTTGAGNTAYSFGATVNSTATHPLTYVWRATDQLPITHTSGLTDTVVFTWPIGASAPQSITVTAANLRGIVTGTHVITLHSEPDLNLSDLSAPARVRPGDRFTYTLNMRNTGTMHAPTATAAGVMPGGVSCTGDLWVSAGSGSCAGNTFSWNGPLNVNEPVTVAYIVQSNSGLMAGTTFSHEVAINDNVTSTVVRGVTTTIAMPYLNNNSLNIDKYIAMLGETIAVTLTLHNDGIDAPQVEATMPVPAYLYSISATSGGAVYNAAMNRVEWLGLVGENQSVQLGFRAIVSDVVPPGNRITITARIADSYSPAIEMSRGIRVAVPDLRPSFKTVEQPYARVGRMITYTLALVNANSLVAHATLTDPLPLGVSFVSASPGLILNSGQNQLEWNGDIFGNTAITLTCVVSVSSVLSDGIPITNTMFLDDGVGQIYPRAATFVTVRPSARVCIDQVCVYADTITDLGTGQQQATGHVWIGSLSRADVMLDEDGQVILDPTNGTISGDGKVMVLANRLYRIMQGPFTITTDSGLLSPGSGAIYLLDELSGFTVPTNTGTLNVTVNVLQGTLAGAAQIESHAGDLDINTQASFAVDNYGEVNAIVGATNFSIWGLPLTIQGGSLDSYGLTLNPKLTLPNNIAQVDIPTFSVYPDGVFAGYVEFPKPVGVNLDGWGIAFNNMVFDSDYGLLFPTAMITLPGGTTATLTNLYLNADGTLSSGSIEGDFAFELYGFNVAGHDAVLTGEGLSIASATLTFPFALDPGSDPLALTFSDVLIGANGNIQNERLSVSAFRFDFMGWQVQAPSGLALGKGGVYIPRADLTFPANLGGNTYQFTGVTVTPDGHLYGSLPFAQNFNLGDWQIDAPQGFSLAQAGVCVPEARVTLPPYLGNSTLHFNSVCLDPAAGFKTGSLSADFKFAVQGWSLQASRATFVGDQLHILTTTLTIPALKSVQVQVLNLQIANHSPYLVGGAFATDIQVDLFGLQVRIPHDKISLGDNGAQIREMTIQLPSSLQSQRFTLTNLNAGPNQITLVGTLSFGVAGMSIKADNSALSAGGYHASKAKLALPSSIGNYQVEVSDVRINASGFSIGGGNVDIQLPSFNIGGGNGLGIREARVRLIFSSNSYLFDGAANVVVPNMLAVKCHIVFGTPSPPTWPYALREARVYIYGAFRIPVGATGVYITGIEGGVVLSNPARFDLTFDFESTPSTIVHGRLGGWVDTWGQFGIRGNAVALNNFVEAYVDASITRARGFMARFDAHTNPRILEGSIQVNIWSADGRTHFTSSGRIRVQLPANCLMQPFCIDIPDCHSYSCDPCVWGVCWQCWGCWSNRWCSPGIPPNDLTLAEIGVDLGEFMNGNWGAKTTVNVLGIAFGLYIDTGGHIAVSNLDNYQLLPAPGLRSNVAGQPAEPYIRDELLEKLNLSADAVHKYVTINPNSGGAIFGLDWYTGTPGLALVAPDGTVITPSISTSSPTIQYQSEDGHQILYAIQNPQPGGWHLIVENPPALEHYRLFVIGASAFPTVTIQTPSALEMPADPAITIQGKVASTYTDTVLSLYTIITPTAEYIITDTNNLTHTETSPVYSGRLLASHIPINPDGNWSYTWNTQQEPLPAGTYYVYAVVEDIRHPPVHAYAPGSIRVVDNAPPTPPKHLMVTTDKNELTLFWSLNTEPDLMGYHIYHGLLTDTFTYTLDVGNMTQFTLVGLDNDIPHYVAVSAYDLSENESALTKAQAVVTQTAPVTCNTPISLTVLPEWSVIAGETAALTLTAHTTASPSGNLCDYAQINGQAFVPGKASVYLVQTSLYLFDQKNSTQVQVYAPPDTLPDNYTIVFSGTVGSQSSIVSTTMHVVPGPAATITLTAEYSSIPGYIAASVPITAYVTDAHGYPVADDTSIIFATTAGTLTPTQVTTFGGFAHTTLSSAPVGPVTATIEAVAGYARGETNVALLWTDQIVVNAKSVQPSARPGDLIQLQFAFGNAGNLAASNVTISVTLPNGITFVRYNTVGLSLQQVGDIPVVWTVPVIEANAGGLITITGRIDTSRNWPNNTILTVPITISAANSDFSSSNNRASVQWIINPTSTHSLYLPLITRNY